MATTGHQPNDPALTPRRPSAVDFDAATLKAALRARRTQPKSAETLAREKLLLPHLPTNDVPRGPVRTFLSTLLHRFILLLIQTLFSIYLKLRWAYNNIMNRVYSVLYYHHRTPQLIEKDVKPLKEGGKFPQHVSVILEMEGMDGIDRLVDEVAEISCWCAAAGIPRLSVYERTGVLKSYIATSHRAIAQQLRLYYGRSRPTLRVHAPHSRSFINGDQPTDEAEQIDLEVMFISEEDGRESLVDLTKTLCDMAQRGKLSSDDVSVELVDAEVKETSMDEPDLLILFSPNITLRGYPPWQLRLTEIYNVQDNDGVGYQVFLRALHRFARAEMRFGR
ncbi:Decaprenyl diphosphate synthase-like protein [Pyronema domesticum]|uniref:ditrans,polycis-polyprenyl diphosphate synthase [(2E,6E)-farnesyldiphosphate specific] n=1 Tax=Pyronema omphalodes (strain CBS 100304) TaxID=1076935 RepID=U4LRJ7_PYROM|nr:Decaprenyl diphosphate synthase-like protein [Pyronema domesticum]CCX31955.1 Similar to Probable undecaprenyl pyrophosphate synthase; acc. no. Q12063 [Pyronema omphalodes CBS 100304]